MFYPEKRDSIKLLLTAAERAAETSTVEHPEDIANAMVVAIDIAAMTIMDCHKEFNQD